VNHRLLVSILGLSWLIAPAAYPQAAKTNSSYTPPRTPDGQPDLQGIWNNATITTLERPAELGAKAFFTPQEAAAYEQRFAVEGNRDVRNPNPAIDVAGAYNQGWFDRGTKVIPSLRTSLVASPADGKIPYNAEGLKRLADAVEHRRVHPADGPEDLPLAERCILWRTAGPPMLPGPYNSNYQIYQTPGYVVIAIEMIHDVRFIPLDGRPHLPPSIRQWMGDSRGHWEGNTLVVDTTNFTDNPRFLGTTSKLHLTERFTRTSADAITYEFTVDDPTVFAKPWSASYPLNRSQGPVYEYACHEGNYAVPGILGGARKLERELGGKNTSR
jgi:hypothetical protein